MKESRNSSRARPSRSEFERWCGGGIVRNITNMILLPTSFSMMR